MVTLMTPIILTVKPTRMVGEGVEKRKVSLCAILRSTWWEENETHTYQSVCLVLYPSVDYKGGLFPVQIFVPGHLKKKKEKRK